MTKENIASFKHGSEVGSVSFSPDGRTLVAGLDFGRTKLWDLATKANITITEGNASWRDQSSSFSSVSFSPDGRTLASGAEDGMVKLLDIATGTGDRLHGHVNVAHSTSFSPDGRTLASGADDGTVRLWDIETGQEINKFIGVPANLHNVVSFSPDGASLGCGWGDGVIVWDVATGREVARFDHPYAYQTLTLAFSPDGRALAEGRDDGIVLWQIATGTRIATPVGQLQQAVVSLSPNGKTLASGSADGKVRLWDASTLTQIAAANTPRDLRIWSVAFSPDGTILASGAADGKVRLWDASTLTQIATIDAREFVLSVDFAPNGTILASGSWDGKVRLWDVHTRQNIATLEGHTGYVTSVEFSPDGTTLASGSASGFLWDGTVLLWDLQSHQFQSPTLEIFSGGDQEGLPGAALENPFVVEVRDRSDKPLPGVQVTFSVTSGGGTLSATSVTTNSNGRAENILTLGPNPGTNTVTVSVAGSQEKETFNAEGIRIPETLDIISGNDQEGLPGVALENPFVVEVRDQTDKPLPGVQVTFSVTSGGGTLSATSVTTNSNGRAENILTLGPNPGTNTVTVSVTGITHTETFNAEGIRIPKRLKIVSGKDQEGLPGAALENPFVVEVRDQTDKPLPGVQVTFSVTSGGGTLSATSVTTNSNGRAENILTLGPNPGTNTVTVSVAGSQEKETFNAEGIRIPETLDIVSGKDQEGLPGAALENPFVVEVRDQTDKPLPGVQVTFSVTSGGGTLSATSVTTNSNGRAENILTLGPNPGTNTVTVSVAGSQEKETFNAEGIRIPETLDIISGNDQEGLPGAALENPFVVEVRDPSGDPLPGVQVTFLVSSGGGTLSATSAMADVNGRAESILTLGPNLGRNTVTVSVTGIQEQQTFTAEGIRIPLAFWINLWR